MASNDVFVIFSAKNQYFSLKSHVHSGIFLKHLRKHWETFPLKEEQYIQRDLSQVFPLRFFRGTKLWMELDPSYHSDVATEDRVHRNFRMIEIYEVAFQFHPIVPIPPICNVQEKTENIGTSETENDNALNLYQFINENKHKLQNKVAEKQHEVDLLAREMKHCSNYFSLTWGTEKELQTPFRTLEKIVQEKNSLNPIVYFNAEGEIFSILRSTILRVIPNSQLAVRVCGRWVEQHNTVDPAGNLLVSVDKESVRSILESLQLDQIAPDYDVEVSLCT
jgi:hypothetical protein